MIPGNHDQVTLQGLEHGLTPLKNAFFLKTHPLHNSSRYHIDSTTNIPGILIFSHPTIFKKAMFIPHIRDVATVQSILLYIHPHNRIHTDFNSTTVESILCHADVTGALMNDHIISTGGVAPSYFPPHLPVYSGHFHKPHLVETTSRHVPIRYVGSPYQVSLAEAGEQKALLVLDSNQGWKCIEEIPLNIGKKHFKCSSIEQFLKFSLKHDTHVTSQALQNPHHNLYTPTPSSELEEQDDESIIVTSGDRVVLSIQQEELEDMKRMPSAPSVFKWDIHDDSDKKSLGDENKELMLQRMERKIHELRTAGIGVEIREIKLLPNYPMVHMASIENSLGLHGSDSPSDGIGVDTSLISSLSLEELSPISTLSSFLYHEVERGAMKNSTATTLFDAGKELLETVEKTGNDSDDGEAWGIQLNRDTTDLCLDSVTIVGFGPFVESVTYPLMNRGLVLLRGSNLDGGSFDR
jgi:DNA repair exonuclease SbcCD nuclease subunit